LWTVDLPVRASKNVGEARLVPLGNGAKASRSSPFAKESSYFSTDLQCPVASNHREGGAGTGRRRVFTSTRSICYPGVTVRLVTGPVQRGLRRHCARRPFVLCHTDEGETRSDLRRTEGRAIAGDEQGTPLLSAVQVAEGRELQAGLPQQALGCPGGWLRLRRGNAGPMVSVLRQIVSETLITGTG